MSTLSPSVLKDLDEASRNHVVDFIKTQESKAKLQLSIHKFTDMCFKKCVQGPITDGALHPSEEECLSNCVTRFLNTNIQVVQALQGASQSA